MSSLIVFASPGLGLLSVTVLMVFLEYLDIPVNPQIGNLVPGWPGGGLARSAGVTWLGDGQVVYPGVAACERLACLGCVWGDAVERPGVTIAARSAGVSGVPASPRGGIREGVL